MEEKEYLIALNLIKGIGPRRHARLLERFKNPKGIFSASLKELLTVPSINGELARQIKDFSFSLLEKEVSLIKEMGIKILLIKSKEYPPLLKAISDPPFILYVKGEMSTQDNRLSIVGTRYCSPYGKMVAEKLSFELASLGFVVVSGMARGIDSSAHRGALLAKGRTIAVLGSGLCRIYPPENSKLAEEISQNGAVISEFPLLTAPERGNFPRRNRIISGLSRGTIVIEAGRKSGALITANLALEQGREVFAVPGNIGQNRVGVHQLIKDGAKLVESVDDILEELEELSLPRMEKKGKGKSKGEEITKTKEIKDEKERVIYNCIKKEPIQIEEIIAQSKLSSKKVSQILINLEMKGLVQSLPGKFYKKERRKDEGS